MNAFFIVCALAALAIVPVPGLQAVLATTASTLFESTPFILAGVALAAAAPRRAPLLSALVGCGCSGGPGALSLPVALATALAFGPLVATARWIAAFAVWYYRGKSPVCARAQGAAGTELLALLPFAAASGAAVAFLPSSALGSLGPVAGAVCGALIAVVAAPCGFGALALAAGAHRAAPFAAISILCFAGICDLRSLRGLLHRHARHDAFAYVLAAFACAAVAWHHGNTLVNPRFTIPLWACAALLLWLSWRHRREATPALRVAPAIMFAGAILSAPPPLYFASETTLSDAFAGERMVFRGALAQDGARASLVRFAVMCCRADAQPVAVRLKNALHERNGQWVVAHGTLVSNGGALALDVATYERTSAPADPFLYR